MLGNLVQYLRLRLRLRPLLHLRPLQHLVRHLGQRLLQRLLQRQGQRQGQRLRLVHHLVHHLFLISIRYKTVVVGFKKTYHYHKRSVLALLFNGSLYVGKLWERLREQLRLYRHKVILPIVQIVSLRLVLALRHRLVRLPRLCRVMLVS